MTVFQIAALKQLIAADRYYHSRAAAALPVTDDDRGVEVWAHGQIARSTATSLVRAGLAELCDSRRNGSLWLFLGSAAPFDPLEDV